MYTALYRKYRPATFGAVVGQSTIVAALQNQVRSGRIGHSYIFTGTRGTGKTTCAKIFAKAVNCETPQGGEPCGICPTCTGIQNGSIFDVLEIDAASNNGVDDVRELREETAYIPAACRYRVYIIDEVHMLSTSAFNALLKIMEEPPAHVIFILATTEIHKVPATILSRCQRFDFARVAPTEIESLLLDLAKQEGFGLEGPAAALLARLGDGAVRDALSLLDTCITVANGTVTEAVVMQVAGVAAKNQLFALSTALQEENIENALFALNNLLGGTVEPRRLTEELIYHYRNILMAGFAGTGADMLGTAAIYFDEYKDAAKQHKVQTVLWAVQLLSDALNKISRGADARIQLEIAVLALCQPPSEQSVEIKNMPVTPRAVRGAQGGAAATQNVAAQTAAPSNANTAQANGHHPESANAEQTPGEKESEREKRVHTAKQSEVTEGAVGNATKPGTLQPFAQWPQVVAILAEKDKLLHASLANAVAYRSGQRVLIAGSGMFLEYMRKNEYSATVIKAAIEEASGEALAIGPYTEPTPEKEDDTGGLARLEKLGAPIEYV